MIESSLKLRINEIQTEARNIIALDLRMDSGENLPDFTPGAHIDLHLGNGLVRSYSLLNSPVDRGHYKIAILRDANSRGGSIAIHDQLRKGDLIDCSAPKNNFPLDETARSTVLIAGGIGITPMFCMFNHLKAAGKSVELFYCARSRVDAPFVETLRTFSEHIHFRFDDEQDELPDLTALLEDYSADAHFYCCGPTPMLGAFEETCKKLGFSNSHIERFSPLLSKSSQEHSYTVKLLRSQKDVEVPAGSSLLDCLLSADVVVNYDCREGICGACEIPVVAGTPEHRDSLLSPEERSANQSMMVCVSGCKGRELVLDL